MALGLRITIPITLFPNVLLETNRTSYFGVIQLLPRQRWYARVLHSAAGLCLLLV
jgi:hypothetical protein